MEKEEIAEINIDGRVFTRRRARVRELFKAVAQPKGKEGDAISAQTACKTCIDGKPATTEDILDLWDDELEKVMKLFPIPDSTNGYSEGKETVTDVTIDGKVFTRRRSKVRELSQASYQPKGKEYETVGAQLACKIAIDGKPAVKEDILDLWDDELDELMKLFPEVEEALKN